MKRVIWRTVGGLAGLGLTLGGMGVMATPAGAQAGFDMTCTARPEQNLCISIAPLPDNHYAVHVGIDVHMTQARAQEFIDNARGPDGPFRVQIYGADHFDDEYLFDLPMTAIGTSNDYGLSADFDLEVIRWKLDEDDNFFDNDDEIYALVSLFQWVPYSDTFFYYSNELSHEY